MTDSDFQKLVETTDQTAQVWLEKPHQLSPATAGEMLKRVRDRAYVLGRTAALSELHTEPSPEDELPPEKPLRVVSLDERRIDTFSQEIDQALTIANQGETQ